MLYQAGYRMDEGGREVTMPAQTVAPPQTALPPPPPVPPPPRGEIFDLMGQTWREWDLVTRRWLKVVDLMLSRNQPAVGLTPKDTVYRRGTMQVYHYRPLAEEVYRVPVIFVMSLVSKPYILDLVPGQSYVEYLLRNGYDVFLIDWGEPRPEDHALRLEDYVLDLLPRALESVQRETGEREHSLLGYCMGGDLSLMYASLFPQEPIKNLVFVATPVDFSGMELWQRWADPRFFDVDRIVDALGNIPPNMVMASFEMLRPADRLAGYTRLWDNLWDDSFVHNFRVRYRWVNEQIAFAGEAYRQMVKQLMWGNKLVRGEFEIGGRRVDPSAVRQPVLHVMSEFDHIAPLASTKPLTSLTSSSEKEDVVLRGGHVSLVSGANAILRLWPKTNEWLAPRSV
jgi:polyhydroxyalkanoate synthase